MKYILLCLLLAGCSTYNESFDCAPGKGVGCVSLSAVNTMVNKGQLPLEDKPRLWIRGHEDAHGQSHFDELITLEDL